jgi:hypothetical protein
MLKDILLPHKNQVDCNMCGVCCGTDCEAKKGNFCEAHPTIIGPTQAEEFRSRACGFTPVQILVYARIACPPAVKYIQNNFGITVDTRLGSNGVPKVREFILMSKRID